MMRRWRRPTLFLLVGWAWGSVQALDRVPVRVHVEVTEVDLNRASSLGVRWLDTATLSETRVPGILKVGPVARATNLQSDLHVLMQEGAAEMLANPDLITDSGTSATFHAGGQIPYATTSSLGATHVEFKPYGVFMAVEPVVLESGLIQMKIKASVSAPDGTNGVEVAGNSVPALLEREVTSNVTLSTGTTVTLAGLVQTQDTRDVQGVPLLKSIPLVGALFRWQKKDHRRTTIIMFVTPQLAEL